MYTPIPAVSASEIAEVLALDVPSTYTAFDRDELLSLIAHSFSFTIDEKKEMVSSVATYSQRQVDELIRILMSEQATFGELNTKIALRRLALD